MSEKDNLSGLLYSDLYIVLHGHIEPCPSNTNFSSLGLSVAKIHAFYIYEDDPIMIETF